MSNLVAGEVGPLPERRRDARSQRPVSLLSPSGDELVKQVTDSTQGFSLVLAGLKAFLEHGIRLNLVADRFPEGDRCALTPRQWEEPQ